MAAGTDDEKKAIRAQMRRSLAALTAGTSLFAGREIALSLQTDSRWAEWSAIALFSCLPGEVDLSELASAARAAGKRIALPCTRADGTMEFREHRPDDPLVPARFGVLEPPREAPVLPPSQLDCVLIPGLAFDSRGGRLGRGAGYYDRALAEAGTDRTSTPDSWGGAAARPLRIGVGFALQVVDRVPMSSLDVRMDACITEAGWLEFDQPGDLGN